MSSTKALSADQVKIWAETMGIQNLTEDAADFIVASVNLKMSAIVDRANKNANLSKRMRILKTDIDSAMQFLNLEPTVDNSVGDYIPIRGVSGVGGRTLYVQDDKERDLQTVVKKHSGPVPAEVTLRQHWLAVEGKQPTVPENPSPLTKDEQRTKAANPLIARKVATEKAVRKSQMVNIKDLAVADLSAEQQNYYRDITEAVIGSNEEKRREALFSLEHDPGLHALVPRLGVFISEGVKINVVQQNLALLIYMMRMVKALLDNQTLYLQPYLHLVIPAVTSCIVSRSLCVRPEVDNHWALRGFASKILSTISRNYDSSTSGLAQRLTQIFKDALDEETTAPATRYGAYCALTELGNETIGMMVVPRVKQEAEALRICQSITTNPADKKAVEQIKDKLTTRVAEYCRHCRPQLEKLDDFRAEFGPLMGPSIYEQVLKDRIKDPIKTRPTVRMPTQGGTQSTQGGTQSTQGGMQSTQGGVQSVQSPLQPLSGGVASPRFSTPSPSSAGMAGSSPNPYFARPFGSVRPSTPVHASPGPLGAETPSVLRQTVNASHVAPSVTSPSARSSASPVDHGSVKREDGI